MNASQRTLLEIENIGTNGGSRFRTGTALGPIIGAYGADGGRDGDRVIRLVISGDGHARLEADQRVVRAAEGLAGPSLRFSTAHRCSHFSARPCQ